MRRIGFLKAILNYSWCKSFYLIFELLHICTELDYAGITVAFDLVPAYRGLLSLSFFF